MSIIIHIDGAQGSGKSYICSKINNIMCIDTDKIMKNAMNYIDKNNLPKTNKTLSKIMNNMKNNLINKHKIIVFVSITLKIPEATYKFFIKINKKDLQIIYKTYFYLHTPVLGSLSHISSFLVEYIKIVPYFSTKSLKFALPATSSSLLPPLSI